MPRSEGPSANWLHYLLFCDLALLLQSTRVFWCCACGRGSRSCKACRHIFMWQFKQTLSRGWNGAKAYKCSFYFILKVESRRWEGALHNWRKTTEDLASRCKWKPSKPSCKALYYQLCPSGNPLLGFFLHSCCHFDHLLSACLTNKLQVCLVRFV